MQSKDAHLLDELAGALQEIGRMRLSTQQEIEAATGVDQTTISRAKSRKLKRVTDKVISLKRYADMRLVPANVSDRIDRAARQFLAAGGTEVELLASIEHATTLITRRLSRA